MAKKFCNIIGLHTIFNNNDVSIQNIKDTNIIDENSIAFITCQNDRAFGQNYVDGLKVIWARGKIYGLGEFQTNYIGGTGIDVQDTQYEFEKFIAINVNNNLRVDSNNFLNAKDTTYEVGENIKITPVEGTQSTDNPRFTISAVNAGAPYTSGQGIQIEDNEVSHNLVTGNNITITDNQDGTTEISAKGYIYDSTTGSFATEYRQNEEDGGQELFNTATGLSAVAEGYNTTASGNYSHAEGQGLISDEIVSFVCSVIGTEEQNKIKAKTGITFTYCDHSDNIDDGYGSQGWIYSDSECTQLVSKITICRYYYTSNYDGDYFNIDTGSLTDGVTYYWKRVCGSKGDASHAEGEETTASGESSHAEGYGTTASGNYSHAEGESTTASGNDSHAEGYNTTASEDYSHAEGEETTASGYCSHAEGKTTTASGYYSHAEGEETTASGNDSHAEGNGTTASGSPSHAEGESTTASGNYSHAEGASTIASGDCSHAEGSNTTASEYCSHAEGESTTASDDYSHAEGTGTTASGEGSHAEGNDTTASEYCSHAEGNSTTASGEGSHAEGYGTTASGNYSHAGGQFTVTNGEASHAEGKDTEADGDYSHSEGEFTSATGNSSHAEGQYTTSFGTASHAEGEGGHITLFRTFNSVDNSNIIRIYHQSSIDSDFGASDSAKNFLAGSDFFSDFDMSLSDSADVPNVYDVEKENKVNGWIGRPLYKADGSIIGIVTLIDQYGEEITIDREVTLPINEAIYIKTSATGKDSHAEGYLSDASGLHSHAEGERTQATGTNAHSEGFKTRAFGGNSHAEGYGTAAYTFGSHAEGKQTQVEGEYSHTEGIDTKASGNFAHGEGKSSSAQGDWSHAEGEDSQASGIGSHAEGTRCNARGAYSHAEGYNTSTEGNFEDVSSSDHSEEWQVAAHAEGKDTAAAQTASHSEGINTRADGDAAHAEGVDSKSLSIGAHAEGINTFVNDHSEGSHTEGYETQTDSKYSHAEGWKTFIQSKEVYTDRNAVVKLSSYNSSNNHVTLQLISGDYNSLIHSFDERKLSSVQLFWAPHQKGVRFHNFIVYSENYPYLEISPRYNIDYWGDSGGHENRSSGDYPEVFNYDNLQQYINAYPNREYQVQRLEYYGYGAHAEGGETYTEGTYAHAEGEHTRALNRGAHSEGFNTQAKEKYSHAEGWYTKATHKAEHAEGRCNKSNDVHINTSVEYVDLDLPSGNLWATCNIGAQNPEDYGDYYAWGETETKGTYDWSTYKWCNGTNSTLTKYCTDSDQWGGSTPDPDELTRLVLEDDIAAKTLGENWRIPSKKDFEELIEHTDNEWTSVNGVNGWKFINKSDSDLYIFLPAAGLINGQALEDLEGYLYYFTSSCNGANADILYGKFDEVYADNIVTDKRFGCSIRPVSSKLKTIHSVGVGESDGDHRNALEITTDGSIFIKGVGDYDGSNPQSGKSLQQLLLQLGSQESGLTPETAIVIAAALNDLNDRINAISQSQP